MAINGNKYVNAETNSYEGHHSPRTRNWKVKPPEPLEPCPLHFSPPLTLYHKVVFNIKLAAFFGPRVMKPPVHAVRDLGLAVKRLRLERKICGNTGATQP